MPAAKLLFLFCLFILLPAAVLAQDADPFGSREDEEVDMEQDGRANIQDENRTFSGPIEKLLDLAGEQKAVKAPQWGNFEKSEKPAEEYDTLFRWRMEQEFEKPVEERPPYKGDLQALKKELEAIRPTNKRDEEYFFRHLHRGDPIDSKGAQGIK